MPKTFLQSTLLEAVKSGKPSVVADAIKQNKYTKSQYNQAVTAAAAKGNAELVTLLLPYANLDINIHKGWEVICDALKNHRFDVVKSFMPVLDKQRKIFALRLALTGGQDTDLVDILLSDLGDTNQQKDSLLKWAIEGKNIELVKRCLLFLDQKCPTFDVFVKAAETGHLNILQLLLSVFQPMPNDNSLSLQSAAAHGHIECVKLLLPLSNPAVRNCASLRDAAKNGHVETVKLLIPVSDVTKSCGVSWAANKGHVEIVKLLLPFELSQHTKNETLVMASSKGFIDIVKLLLNDSSFDRSQALKDGQALKQAAINGRSDIVELLLAYKPSEDAKNSALVEAADNGHLDIIKLLLFVSNPKYGNSLALQKAVKSKHIEIVKLLIPVSDPQADDSQALRTAASYGNVKLINLLLPVSDPKACDNETLKNLLTNKLSQQHLNIFKQLLPLCNPKCVLDDVWPHHHNYEQIKQIADNYEMERTKKALNGVLDGINIDPTHKKRKM